VETTQLQYIHDLLACQTANVAFIRAVQGIQDYIKPDKPPASNKDVMSQPHAQEWAEQHQKEYQDFKDRMHAIVLLPKGAKVLGTTL
jgi:hypothetical protein